MERYRNPCAEIILPFSNDPHYPLSSRSRRIAENAGITYDNEMSRVVDNMVASLGLPADEAMDHIIGAMQYLTDNNFFILDSISEEPREKVNWKKEGF